MGGFPYYLVYLTVFVGIMTNKLSCEPLIEVCYGYLKWSKMAEISLKPIFTEIAILDAEPGCTVRGWLQ